MIDTIKAFATKFKWLKPIALVFGGLSLAIIILTIFSLMGFTDDRYLIPGYVGLLWSALLYFLLATFPAIPSAPDHQLGWLTKWRIKCRRGFYRLLSLAFVGLTIAVLLLSLKLFSIWVGQF